MWVQCPICKTSFFRSSEELSLHLISTHPSQNLKSNDVEKRRYLCEICGESLSTKYNLKRHTQRCPKNPINHELITNSKRETETAKESRRCKNCNKHFTRNENLKKHESSCGSAPVSTSLLHDARRKGNHVGEAKCAKCEKIFVNRTKYLDHWSKCRMGGVRDVPHTFSYRCLSCNRHFDNLESKKKHYKTCVGGGILDNLHFKFDVLKGKSFRNTSYLN